MVSSIWAHVVLNIWNTQRTPADNEYNEVRRYIEDNDECRGISRQEEFYGIYRYNDISTKGMDLLMKK